MLVPILIFALFVFVVAFLIALASRSSLKRFYRWEISYRDGRIKNLQAELEESENELRVAVAGSKWPPVRVSPVVQKLFSLYGGPERTASVIAENFVALEKRHEKVWAWLRQSHRKQKNFKRKWKHYREETRRLREDERLVRAFYEDVAEV